MPKRKRMKKPPEFGYEEIGFLEANSLGTLLEVSETIEAKPGEGREEFLARIKKVLGVGSSGDKVRIVYRAGKPQYANARRRAYDTIPAPPKGSLSGE